MKTKPLRAFACIRFVRCIWYLGFRDGWRYFKLDMSARENPDMVLLWINNLEAASLVADMTGNYKLAECMQIFAEEMKASHRAYVAANKEISGAA